MQSQTADVAGTDFCTTSSIDMAYVKSKYRLCTEVLSFGRHYLSQTDTCKEVDIDVSSPYSPTN